MRPLRVSSASLKAVPARCSQHAAGTFCRTTVGGNPDMSIIPITGMANALMAVTISLHPSAHHGQASYTVRQGDTLSTIAAHAYHNAADWPAVWWANRRQVHNPNMIAKGQRLRLPASGHVTAAMAHAAQAAIPAPPPPAQAPAAPVSSSQGGQSASAPVYTAAPASSGGA